MSNSTPAESRSTACGPTLPATLTVRAVLMVGADACWWPRPWNWVAMMLKLIVASEAFSKPWRPGWLVHFPVRRRRASWPMVLSLQVPPEFSSVSSRGCEWSVKRHRHGLRRKPPLTLFSAASSEHDPEKWEPVFRKDHAQTKG